MYAFRCSEVKNWYHISKKGTIKLKTSMFLSPWQKILRVTYIGGKYSLMLSKQPDLVEVLFSGRHKRKWYILK